MSATMLVCKVCGNTWLPRVINPTRCADYKCQSRNWNKSLQDLEVEELREILEILNLRITTLQTLHAKTKAQIPRTIQRQKAEAELQRVAEEKMRRRAKETGLQQLADEAESELQATEE